MPATRLLVLVSVLLLSACGSAQTTSTSTTNDGDDVASGDGEPIVVDERPCGSRGLAPCADTEYCDFPDGSQCGATDAGGVCRERPQMCTREYNPVCGCDGQTHPTACTAASQGVDVASPGACEGDATEPPPPG